VILAYIWTILKGIIFLYVQILIMPNLELWGVIPNIVLPWMIYTVWKKPFQLAVISGFVIALMYDVAYPVFFGFNSLIFMIVAIVIDLFRIPFEEQSVMARMLTLVLVNFVVAILNLLTFGISGGFGLALYISTTVAFFYNLGSSFAIFWMMIFLAKLRIVATHE